MSKNIIVKGNTIAIKDKDVPVLDIEKYLKKHLQNVNEKEIKFLSKHLKKEGMIWDYKSLLSLDLILS